MVLASTLEHWRDIITHLSIDGGDDADETQFGIKQLHFLRCFVEHHGIDAKSWF